MTQAKNIVAQNVVEIRGRDAFTNTLIVAEACDVTHQAALKIVRKYKPDFEECGQLGTEIRVVSSHGAGKPTEIYLLNEDQATLLVLMFRNTEKVREFKLALVKAFRKALNEISRRFQNPPRTDILKDKRAAHNPMMDALIEFRADQGKETEAHHYQCENRLCNWVVSGEFKAIDEKTISNEDAAFLAKIRKRNEAYILAGLDYATRKAKLNEFAIRQRTKMLEANP